MQIFIRERQVLATILWAPLNLFILTGENNLYYSSELSILVHLIYEECYLNTMELSLI
jgi:hypothetical protein